MGDALNQVMNSVKQSLLCLSLALLVGCAMPSDPTISPPADASSGDAPVVNCNPPPFTYADFGSAFLTRYCNSCHGFTQQDMQADPTVFIDVAVTSTYMPPPSTVPSPTERSEFGTWLACGAP